MNEIETRPLTPDRWDDLEKLFGSRGACGGCWCMFWRLSRREFEQQKGEPNRLALKRIVATGEIPGLLAYSAGEPIGWVCVGPRERFSLLEKSKVLARFDEQPVWSIVCFFTTRKFRRQGISVALLEAAGNFAKMQGAKVLEGYPSPPQNKKQPDAFVYTGLESIFPKCGFALAERRGKSGRGIWRKDLI